MWLFYIAIFVLFVYILDDYLLDKRQFELSKQFNSPRRLPLIGHAHFALFIKPKDFIDLLKSLYEKYMVKFPPVIVGFVGPYMEVGFSDQKYIEKLLTNNKFLSKSSYYNFLSQVLGEGLLFSTNQKWHQRRKIITPTFHFKILEQFFDVFQKQNLLLVKDIEKKVGSNAFDIIPMVSSSVLKSLCETAMGYEMKEQDFEYLNAVRDLSYQVANSFLSPWHRIKFIFNLTPSKRAQDKCANIMRKFTTKIINERRETLEKTGKENLENLDDVDVGLKRRMCLLDVLLQSTVENKPLSISDIQEEVDTFTFAGHDTTTNAISFTLYMIAKHPEVQAKLNQEIENILGDDGELTFKILNEFKYLELVIKETLRLFPPVPIISRRLFEEVDFGDFIAPANSNYNLAFYDLFRNPKIFENPNDFIPERFLKPLPPFAFIPFSAGSRNCIGQKFAMTNIKNNIINIVRRFELIDGKVEPKIELHITLKCKEILIGFKNKK